LEIERVGKNEWKGVKKIQKGGVCSGGAATYGGRPPRRHPNLHLPCCRRRREREERGESMRGREREWN